MNLEGLIHAEPTMSDNASYVAIIGILNTPHWRCYTTKSYNRTHELVERFMRAHGQAKGLVTDTMLSPIPAEILYFTDHENGIRIKGGIWINGAVTYVTHSEKGPTTSLFIDDETAQMWGYPDEGYVYIPEESKKKESSP